MVRVITLRQSRLIAAEASYVIRPIVYPCSARTPTSVATLVACIALRGATNPVAITSCLLARKFVKPQAVQRKSPSLNGSGRLGAAVDKP